MEKAELQATLSRCPGDKSCCYSNESEQPIKFQSFVLEKPETSEWDWV